MRNHRYLKAVFLDIFGLGIAHQAPPLDKFHPGQVGKKVAHLGFLNSLPGSSNSMRLLGVESYGSDTL
jgi:hypothetical protein